MSTYRRGFFINRSGEYVSDLIEATRFIRFLNVDSLLGDQPVYMQLNQSIASAGLTGAALQAQPSLWLAQIPIQTRYTYDLGKPYSQCHVYLYRGDGGLISGRLDTEIEPFGDIIDRIPAGTTDILDRPGRLLGHVTVDSQSTPVQAGNQNTFGNGGTSTVNVQALLFAANASRKKFQIYNESLLSGGPGLVEVSEGGGVQIAVIGPGQTYESDPPIYTGPLYFTPRLSGTIPITGIEYF
jgi:hypothetical protein